MNMAASSEVTTGGPIVIQAKGKRSGTRSTGSFVSWPMVRHNIKRLWPMSVVGSAVLLISGPVVAMLSNTAQDARVYAIRSMLNDENIGFLAYQILAPMLMAIAVFSYLDSTGRVAVVHSMPLTRGSLFRSNVIAGFILLFIPQLLLTITLLPFVRGGFKGFLGSGTGYGNVVPVGSSPVSAEVGLAGGSTSARQRIPDMGDLLRWFILASVIMLFVYSLSVLAAILTGNIGIAVLVSVLLNAIVPALYALTLLVLSMFLYGFSYGTVDGIAWMHPLLDLARNGARLSPWPMVVFIGVSALILYASMALYRRFQSEHAGNHVTFSGFNLIATVLTTFVGACLIGLLIESIASTYEPVRPHHAFFFLGVALGAPVIFVVVSMILCGTIKVFTMGSLKRFGAFLVLAAVFFSLTCTDITGYESRLPEEKDIAEATLPVMDLMTLPYAGTYGGELELTDAKSLAAVRELHAEIVDRAKDPQYDSLFTPGSASSASGDSTENASSANCPGCSSDGDNTWFMNFHYRMRSGSSMDRSYTLYQKYIGSSPAYQRLINDPGFRKATSLQHLGYGNIQSSSLSDLYGNTAFPNGLEDLNGPDTSMGASDAQTFARLLDEDYESMPDTDFASTMLSSDPDASTTNPARERLLIGVSFQLSDGGDLSSGSVFYGITKEYTRTIQWLKDKGLYDTMVSDTRKLMNQ